MKYTIPLSIAILIGLAAFCEPSMAQTRQVICTPGTNPNTGNNTCVDVNSTNPLPVTMSGGGATTVTQSANSLIGVKGIDGSTITTGFNPVPVLIAPSASQGVSTQSCTVACASSIVTGGHGLYGLSFSSTVAGWLLIYDATTCAANGTVTPKKAIAYTVIGTTMGVSWNNAPMIDTTGTAACFSTTGPFTATASTTAYISLDFK